MLPERGISRKRTASSWLLPALVLGAAGCAEPPEGEIAPPEIAEVDEIEPTTVDVDGDEIELEPGTVEFDRAYPITAEDVGDVMLVSGTVVGAPGPEGFFVEVESNRIVFVESSDTVSAGDTVRVLGPLQAAEVAVFDGWERELLGDPESDWDVLRLYSVEATSVSSQ